MKGILFMKNTQLTACAAAFVLLANSFSICAAQQEYPVLQKRLSEAQDQVKKLTAENEALKAEIMELRKVMQEAREELKKHAKAASEKEKKKEQDKNEIPIQPGSDISVAFVSIANADFGKKLTFKLKNTSGKRIKAIKGGITFQDQFGDKMGYFSAGVTIDDPMDIDAVRVESGVWTMLDDRIGDLLEKSHKDVKLVWNTSKVIYDE